MDRGDSAGAGGARALRKRREHGYFGSRTMEAADRISTAEGAARAVDADRLACHRQVVRLAAGREPPGRAAAVCARAVSWSPRGRIIRRAAWVGTGHTRA